MKHLTPSALRSGIELILPDDCRFDAVPGHGDLAPWTGNTDDYRAWAAAWARPSWDDFTWGDSDVNGRAIPRTPRALKI